MKSNPNLLTVVSGYTEFTKRFYNILSQDERFVGKNLFYSPLSIHNILSLTYQAADGKTAEEFANILCVPDKDVTAKGYNSIIQNLLDRVDIPLHLANKIFMRKDFPPKEKFSKIGFDFFSSEVKLLNFEKSTESAAIINNWAEEETNSRVTDLISENSLNESTGLVVASAVYFEGNWAYEFKMNLTMPFHISKDEIVNCIMMHKYYRYKFDLNQDLDAKILELPYSNKDISMVIILPNKIDGIADLEKKLASVDLSRLTKYMNYQEVVVFLPKFKIETTMDLKPVLKGMGLSIFDEENCNLSEISDNRSPLAVSQVIQKAFIEVNETGINAKNRSFYYNTKTTVVNKVTFHTMTVDRPFIFFLHRRKSGVVLFCGRVIKPCFN